METKLPVDAGLMSIMPESFVKRFNGDIDAGGGTTVGPFTKPQRLTVRVRRCWRGAFRFTRRVPAGERIYIGDPCYPFNSDKNWHDVLDLYWNKPKELKKEASFSDTGGDGTFPVLIEWENA